MKFGTPINSSARMKIQVNFFISGVMSCQQLITAAENENQSSELKFCLNVNFSVHMKSPVNFFSFQLSLAVIS